MALTLLIMMKAYHVRDWECDRENAETRKYQQLLWYRSPVKLLGEGLGHTLAQPERRGPFLLGMFKVIVDVAASGKKGERGWLVRNGTVMTPERLSNFMRLPADYFQEALKFFSEPPMDWLECIEYAGAKNGDSPDVIPPIGRTPGDSPDVIPPIGRTPGDFQHPTDRPTEVQRPIVQGGGGPSDPEIFALVGFGPEDGLPPAPREFAVEWIARMAGRTRGWPADWQRKFKADWREACGKPVGKKNAPAKKPRERWQVEKELAAAREQIQTHPKKTWPGNKPLPAKIAAEFDALVARRKTLEKELCLA